MNIKAKVLTALRWTMVARFAGQLLSWAVTIVVMRMLSPGDYGLMAMAVVLVSFLTLVNTIGLDAVLVQKRDLDESVRRTIFGIVIVVNLAFFVSMLLVAPSIAAFYGEPRLVPIIHVLAFQFVILIFETLPLARLEREMNFKSISVIEFITALTGSAAMLVMAFAGLEVWALVWGMMIMLATRILGLNIVSPAHCRPQLSLRQMKKIFSFGGFVTVDRGLWFIFAEADKFIGGKLLGKELLGYYAVANHLASLPIQKLAGLINAVALPAFSQVHRDTGASGYYLLKVTQIMSLAAFPVFLGISSVAPELALLLLGEKWRAVALPMQILSLVMPLRMIAHVLSPLLWSIGRPDVSATNFLIAVLIMPAAFIVGAHWGVVGLSLAWLAAYPLVFLISVVRTVPLVGRGIGEFLGAMWRPAIASLLMYGAVVMVKPYALGQAGDFVYLMQLILVGVLVYAATISVLYKDGVREAMGMLRS